MTVIDATAAPVEMSTDDLWPRSITDPSVYVDALARFDSDPRYRAALIEWWTAREYEGLEMPTGEDLEWDVSEYRKRIPEALREHASGVQSLNLIREASAGKDLALTFVNDDPQDWLLITLDCPECFKPIRITRSGQVSASLPGLQFLHMVRECSMGGAAKSREWLLSELGMQALSGPSMDTSFLDDPQEAPVDTTSWLIPGMFARGDYWSLFGPSEVGKSLLALDWSLQMARAGERVLYLDRENSIHVLQARLKKMGATRKDLLSLIMMPFVEIKDLATEAGAAELHALVKKYGATVVVLDTISKFSETGQATHSDRWQKMYNHSFVPLLKAGVSVGQLDHTGLSDKTRERDSSAKRDNVSVAWALTWRGKDRLTLTRAKNRPNYASPGSVAVERTDEPILTHVYGQSVPDEIRKALEELERLGVAAHAGRPTARAALEAAGVSMADKVLEQAIRIRKSA